MEHLHGRLVSELLEERADDIGALRERLLQPAATPTGDASEADGKEQEPLDLADVPSDFYLFRYLLNEGESEDQVALADATVRKSIPLKLKWVETLRKAAAGERLPQDAAIREHVLFDFWENGNDTAPPTLVVRSGYSNPSSLMDNFSHEQVVEWLLWQRCQAWKRVMEVERKTSRFSFLVSINDFENMSLLTAREPRFFKALADTTDLGHQLFPCISGKHAMVNIGWTFRTLFAFARWFMPERTVRKVGMCGASDTRTQDPSDCPYCRKFGIGRADLPNFLGGSIPVEEGSSLCPRRPGGTGEAAAKLPAEEKMDVLDIAGNAT